MEEDSECITLFLFLVLSIFVEFALVEFPDDLEVPTFDGLVKDCLLFVTFVVTGDDTVSFAEEDFRRCTAGLPT